MRRRCTALSSSLHPNSPDSSTSVEALLANGIAAATHESSRLDGYLQHRPSRRGPSKLVPPRRWLQPGSSTPTSPGFLYRKTPEPASSSEFGARSSGTGRSDRRTTGVSKTRGGVLQELGGGGNLSRLSRGRGRVSPAPSRRSEPTREKTNRPIGRRGNQPRDATHAPKQLHWLATSEHAGETRRWEWRAPASGRRVRHAVATALQVTATFFSERPGRKEQREHVVGPAGQSESARDNPKGWGERGGGGGNTWSIPKFQRRARRRGRDPLG